MRRVSNGWFALVFRGAVLLSGAVLLFGAVLLSGAVLLAGCAGSTGSPERPLVPPGLQAQNLDGNSVTLASLKGQVVVLDFFSQYCEPCVDGLPAQVALQERFSNDGVVVMLVAQDEDPAVLEEFLGTMGAGALPVVLDREQHWFDAFGLKFVPGLIVLDRAGKVAGRYPDVSEATHAEVLTLVERLSNE